MFIAMLLCGCEKYLVNKKSLYYNIVPETYVIVQKIE